MPGRGKRKFARPSPCFPPTLTRTAVATTTRSPYTYASTFPRSHLTMDAKNPSDPPPVNGTAHSGSPALDQASRYDLERQVLERAVRGECIDDIAIALTLSIDETKSVLHEALQNLRVYNHANTAAFRDIQHVRLEMATRGLWPGIEAGDTKAVMALVAISRRMSELWGLDAPTKLALTDPTGGRLKKLRLLFGADAV